VRTVMGSPDSSREMDSGIVEWSYRFSSITFRNGRVIRLSNESRNLALNERDQGASKGSETGSATRSPATLFIPGGFSAITGQPGVNGKTNPLVEKVGGYTSSSGAEVGSYYRTRADGSRSNNYSSRGNVNSYTGQQGYR
jgi:hypothetical protein